MQKEKSKAKRLNNFGNPTCLPPCTDKCKLKCFQYFSEKDGQQIFNDYWERGKLEKQRQFLSTSMTSVCPKYRYVQENSHRRPNNVFFFEVKERGIRLFILFFNLTFPLTTAH